ncbi:MAG: S24 family peptidase [Deltaproteobacteria bacterium]|nr:S24 family peptidase [Deltaproteobacteria bacterium]
MASSILPSKRVSSKAVPWPDQVPADFAAGVTGRCLEPILFEGDVIHFKRDQKPRDGSIVLVELQGRKMIKMYSRQGENVILRTTGPGFYDFLIRPDTVFRILGTAWMMVSVKNTRRDLAPVFDACMNVSTQVFAAVSGRADVLGKEVRNGQ